MTALVSVVVVVAAVVVVVVADVVVVVAVASTCMFRCPEVLIRAPAHSCTLRKKQGQN